MTALSSPAVGPAVTSWTCPFCPLLCDHVDVKPVGAGWQLSGSACSRAAAALTRFGSAVPLVPPLVDGLASDLPSAVAAAAARLAASRQPLFGGLGTDVAGARALYPLACKTGAICDVAAGPALWHGLHALQDRGAFTTTLAEVRNRADLVVCVGASPGLHYPEFLPRCGLGGEPSGTAQGGPSAQVVTLLPTVSSSESPPSTGEALAGEVLAAEGDLFDIVTLLAAHVARRLVGRADGPLAALAQRLHAARYAVLVYETGRLPAQGALIIEAIQRIVSTLNRSTRAAALALGGADGASTVNATFTWLSGLPLRTRASLHGLEHEPLAFDASRLLADGAVDALLWVASFGTEPPPPVTSCVRIVLGHPCFAEKAQGRGSIFIPVSTPGMGSAGHLLRTDGSVMLPLHAAYADSLPTVAEVVRQITQALPLPTPMAQRGETPP